MAHICAFWACECACTSKYELSNVRSVCMCVFLCMYMYPCALEMHGHA